MGTQDKPTPVSFEEELDAVRSELYNISRVVRVSNIVWLDAQLLVVVSWVRPKNIYHELLFRSHDFVRDVKRSLNLLYLIKVEQGAAYSSMQTHNSFINYCSKGQPVEQVVDFVKN